MLPCVVKQDPLDLTWVYNLNEVNGESCAAIKQEETANLNYIQSELFSISFHSLSFSLSLYLSLSLSLSLSIYIYIFIYLFIYLLILSRCTINSSYENMILAKSNLQK
jgi:hypothetical protein